MKTNILEAIFALAVMVAAGYGVNKSMQHDADLSDMALSNVEALANWEEGSPCGGPKTYGECESLNSVNCKDLSGCQ